jgi:mannose-6-phosphate isomerase-like protein (cupin superfamily)
MTRSKHDVRYSPKSGHVPEHLRLRFVPCVDVPTISAVREAVGCLRHGLRISSRISYWSRKMSVEGLILHHGEAHGVTLHHTRIDYLVTAEHSKQCSLFEFTVAPGFNTGAHYHTKIEEIFYVLEGELELRCGERTVRGGPGTCVFVPPGAAHAFGNSGLAPGRMLLITAPPGHEKYFDELRDLIAKGGKPDPDALAKLRAKHDTVQLATLTTG